MDMCKYNNRRGTSVTLPLASIQNRQKEGERTIDVMKIWRTEGASNFLPAS
jgi:hypothetical protein